MEKLLKHITERVSGHGYCVIYESQLGRVWPKSAKENEQREAAIREFAKQHGLSAIIRDPGIRVTFKKG